jgi:hypothetical protein
MSNVTKLSYVFGKPRYPVLVDVDGFLVAAKSGEALLKKLAGLNLPANATFDALDGSGEGFGVYVFEDSIAVSPLTVSKSWTKLELIRLFNGRKNRPPDDQPYSEKSLASKRLGKIIADIVRLVLEADKRLLHFGSELRVPEDAGNG